MGWLNLSSFSSKLWLPTKNGTRREALRIEGGQIADNIHINEVGFAHAIYLNSEYVDNPIASLGA
jgi:hypothetical protein